MRTSKMAKVAAAVAAMLIVTAGVNAKKPPKPPPEPELTVHSELWGASFDPESLGSWCAEGGLVQQPDGKFLNVGSYYGHDPMLAQVTRWNIDGSVDTEFGNDAGRMVKDFGSDVGVDHVHDVTVQPDGKIVIVGTSDEWSAPWIARLNTDGSFDETFGDLGIVDNLLPTEYAQFRQVTVLLDGSIVAAGGIADNPWSPLLVKFTSDGDIDTSFGSDGFSIVNLGAYSAVVKGNGFSELPDGRLVAPGAGPYGDTSAVFMFNANGSLDTSFGNNGLAEIDLEPGGAEFFHDLAIQPDGKIVAVGGTSTDPSTSVIAHHPGFPVEQSSIARFNADGSLDTKSFVKRVGGMQLDLAAGGRGHFASVGLLSDGRIIAAGVGDPGIEGRWDIYLARFQTNGSLDTSFDGNGWINLNEMEIDYSVSLVVLADDHYMVGANGRVPGVSNTPYLLHVWEE